MPFSIYIFFKYKISEHRITELNKNMICHLLLRLLKKRLFQKFSQIHRKVLIAMKTDRETALPSYDVQRRFELCIPEIKLRGLVPNFPVHISVRDLYIPRIGPPILPQTACGNMIHLCCCSQISRPLVGIYKSLTDV